MSLKGTHEVVTAGDQREPADKRISPTSRPHRGRTDY